MAGELRKSILEINDIPEEIVIVEEWDDKKILVRGMTGRQRANFLRRSTTEDGQVAFDRFYAELVIATAHDPEDGEQIFEASDRDQLNTKSGAALQRIVDVAQRLSGLGGVAEVEEAKKD